jgi:hypothetical protein
MQAPEIAPDWADELAKTFETDLYVSNATPEAHALVAARLRLCRQQGIEEGLKLALAAVTDEVIINASEAAAP